MLCYLESCQNCQNLSANPLKTLLFIAQRDIIISELMITIMELWGKDYCKNE